jgi:tripartite-type tricarboxylate transporter receptor subunit TctC
MRWNTLLACGLAAGALFGTACADAQSYPARPIRLIVPYPPGGGSDLAGRIIGNELGSRLGQNVIVDNRSGAQGGVGTALVGKATPDGYTLLLFVGALVVNPWVYKDVDFDPVKDFAYVSLVTSQPSVAAVSPNFVPTNLKDLAALAAAKPNFVKFGYGSISGHLTGELFMLLSGTKMQGVPYKGAGPAILDVAGGRIDLVFASPPSSIPMIRTGRLRGLAVIGPERLPAIPDVPTSKELGYPEFEVDAWYAIAAPAKTPRTIVTRLNTEIRRTLETPAVKEGLSRAGLDARSNTPEEMTKYAKLEFDRWGKVAKAAGLKPE